MYCAAAHRARLQRHEKLAIRSRYHQASGPPFSEPEPQRADGSLRDLTIALECNDLAVTTTAPTGTSPSEAARPLPP